MTPLPKKKHTRGRSNIRRRASYKFTLANFKRCPSCKKLSWSHHVCPHCGYYAKGK